MTGVSPIGIYAGKQMPKYRCHKEVWALKIAFIDADPIHEGEVDDGHRYIVPADTSYGPFRVEHAYVQKHKPVAGGYYVVYSPDGYQSFSPADVFEAGYTRL